MKEAGGFTRRTKKQKVHIKKPGDYTRLLQLIC